MAKSTCAGVFGSGGGVGDGRPVNFPVMRISALLFATGCLLAAVRASSSDEESGSPLTDQGDQLAYSGVEDFGEEAMELAAGWVDVISKGLGRLLPFGRKHPEQAVAGEEKSSSTRMTKYMVVLGLMIAIAAASGVAMYEPAAEVVYNPFTERTCEQVLTMVEMSCHLSPGTLFEQLQHGSPFPISGLREIDWSWTCDTFKDSGFFDSFKFAVFNLSDKWAECLKNSTEYVQLTANFDQQSFLQFGMPWTEVIKLFTQQLLDGIKNGTALLSPKELPWEVDDLFTNVYRSFSQIIQKCQP